MSQKRLQEELLQILDEWNAESGALAKKYLKDGIDSHSEEFGVIRDKYADQIRALAVRYSVPDPASEDEQ